MMDRIYVITENFVEIFNTSAVVGMRAFITHFEPEYYEEDEGTIGYYVLQLDYEPFFQYNAAVYFDKVGEDITTPLAEEIDVTVEQAPFLTGYLQELDAPTETFMREYLDSGDSNYITWLEHKLLKALQPQ